MSNEKYSIIVSGEKLVFTRDQIQSEPGNYFATFFFGGFAEASRGVREISVEKDIHLFKLIQAHLRGYVVLPLADAAIPPYMTKETALENLLREARYYGLQRLEDAIKSFGSDMKPSNLNLVTKQPSQGADGKRYKFAKFTGGEWVVNDTTHEGYQIIMGRIVNHPDKVLTITRTPICPGFTQVICWRDLPGEGGSVLLVSNDPEGYSC